TCCKYWPSTCCQSNSFFSHFYYIYKMKILVVDLDNTLFDTRARYNACLAEQGVASLDSLHGEARRRFWECYQSPKYMDFDIPNQDVLNVVKKAKEKGWIVILLTGRNGETQREKTLEQLQKFGVPYDYLIMRNPNDYRKEVEYKREILSSLKGLGDVVVIDDNPEVRKLVSKAYPPDEIPIIDEVKEQGELSVVFFTRYPPVVTRGVNTVEHEEVVDLE
ncbi:HAD family acid phosphatase, partial [Thermofilum sp.]|uniref:HAD family acid phosphatase n=1 Tax=Thermofilum sp. TaxID=1961369 RepID=UPI002586E59F